MKFRQRQKEELDVNITPLIDVVFLLLIFFMVSTTFDRDSELKITLPQASEEYSEVIPETVSVDIDEQGRVYINKQSLVNAQLDTIREAMREAVKNMEDPPIVINADANTSHQNVVKVMDAARQLGLVKITFTTQRINEGD